MGKKTFVAVLATLMCTVVFAMGSKDIEKKELGEVNSWDESFDINTKKNGKWNVLVTAEDKAGNIAESGPFNIWLDPASDLPIIGITNPAPNLRVPGHLNIVGTCSDDDAVSYVSLILDGNEDNILRASGKEFWSYFVDTTNLLEGPHTIEVWGTDINGLNGNHEIVTWQLDRHAPEIVVTSLDMGTLVSGKITLNGSVMDGNGIEKLSYSTDRGASYADAKLKITKLKEPDENGCTELYEFSIPVDTKLQEDGAATCMFRAVDKAGSVGEFTFLYFVDNTKPDVRIVSPTKDERVNGIFTVAGYAKDTIGLESLSWQWGTESGEFELIAGNPYFTKEINTIGMSSAKEFVVTAVDTMGNTVTVKKSFHLDQEADKPVVKINYPVNNGAVEGEDGLLYVRGIVTDDDGVAKIFYKLDNGAEYELACEGVFYAPIEGELSYGKHSITVYAIDKHGVKGNPVTTSFEAKGVAPTFNGAKIGSDDFTDGMSVNPEASPTYSVNVASTSGLKALSYTVNAGGVGAKAEEVKIKGGEKTYNVSVPLSGDDAVWGAVRIAISATDIFGRTTVHNALVNVMDLTQAHTETPGVYFDDSTVADDGSIIVSADKPASGYFVGGTARTVEIVPATRAASARLDGNSIILVPGNGGSGDVRIRVTTTSGAVYNSKPVHFLSTEAAPTLTIDSNSLWDSEAGLAVDVTQNTSFRVTGSISSETAATLRYRILSAQATVSEGIVTGSNALPVPEITAARNVTLGRGNSFSVNFSASDFVDGVSVIEFIASNSSGNQVAQAVPVRKIAEARTELLEGETSIPSPAGPAAYWLKGLDYYAVGVFQGSADKVFKRVEYSSITPSQKSLSFSITPSDSKKYRPASASVAVSKPSNIDARVITVDGKPYASGMKIEMDQKESGHSATVRIVSEAAISSVKYSISGESFAGGSANPSGSASVRQVEGNVYEADIPFGDLPARINEISATITDSNGGTFNMKAHIIVVRRHEVRDSGEKVFWAAGKDSQYDTARSRYILAQGGELSGFVNTISGELTASLVGSPAGLSVSMEKNVIHLTATADGAYNGVVVRVRNAEGGTWNAPAINLIVDSSGPTVTLQSPLAMSFVRNTLSIRGTVTDGNGVQSLEYSLADDIGKPDAEGNSSVTWRNIPVSRGSFTVDVPLNTVEDGYVPLTLRATDVTGKVSYYNTSVHKDTTAPEVKVIIPEAEAVVNGETEIAFIVKDNGITDTIRYQSANGRYAESFNLNEPVAEGATGAAVTMKSSMPNMIIGTAARPMDNNMVYRFTDRAGNTTTLSSYEFKVDNESDLPVSEVHLPAENEVITKDFVISGVIYDDDGPCTIYFRLDNGRWEKLSEPSNCYKIEIPISAMTDNEHSVSVYAEDIHGVRGQTTVRKFRVSLEEPKGNMTEPSIEKTVHEQITLRGVASDRNGIKKVQISLDNGATFNDATGTTNWSYTFDTRAIQDGTHVVFIKIWDNYDITGLYSSMINIDNTAPTLSLELPFDDSTTTRNVFFSGQTTDNIELTQLYITVRSLDPGRTVPSRLSRINLVPSEIITQVVDISELANGFYNIELTGVDRAENITRVSRNIQLNKSAQLTTARLLYPLNGEHVQGTFNIYGQTESEEDVPETAILYIDGRRVDAIDPVAITDSGYFKFQLRSLIKKPDTTSTDAEGNTTTLPGASYELTAGIHSYYVVTTTRSGKNITSNTQTFVYNPYGPWVTLDNFTYGDFAFDRPMLKGDSGYALSPEDIEMLNSKESTKFQKEQIKAKSTVARVWVSLDNGRTYLPASKANKSKWQYRVESYDIEPGYHFLLVKAEMQSGDIAITRALVQVDRTDPTIRLISPGVGGKYNQTLAFHGLASDDISLKNVTLMLRPGDKNAYQMPGFIQGLFLDASVWGATLWNVGAGLTAFDNAVKIEMSFGQFTQDQRDFVSDFFQIDRTNLRFGGNVVGLRIIAQILDLPFMTFFGRDWEWLSATLSVGANFSFFTDTGAKNNETGEPVPQILSALLMQLEFPRMSFKQMKNFRTWAIYLEPQLWFIPSDIATDEARKILFTMSLGLHVNVF